MSSEPNDESNSQTIDNNVDKVQKVEKPVTETLNEYFLKTKEFVESIDVKESVRVRREQLNEIIEKNVFVAESIKVALHPEAFKKDFMGALTVCSTKLNDKYPYEASLCRSHEYLVIAGAVTIASLPFLSKFSIIAYVLLR